MMRRDLRLLLIIFIISIINIEIITGIVGEDSRLSSLRGK